MACEERESPVNNSTHCTPAHIALHNFTELHFEQNTSSHSIVLAQFCQSLSLMCSTDLYCIASGLLCERQVGEVTEAESSHNPAPSLLHLVPQPI